MPKLMSKSELIQKIADQQPNGLSRKDIKGVIENTCDCWLQRTQENGSLL